MPSKHTNKGVLPRGCKILSPAARSWSPIDTGLEGTIALVDSCVRIVLEVVGLQKATIAGLHH